MNKYDGEFPDRWANEIFNYLSLRNDNFQSQEPLKLEFDREYYDRLTDKFRSPHLWRWDDSKGWILRHQVCNDDALHQEATAASWQGNTAITK